MNPRALLVLGMHRSGTSALTRVLNLLGARLSRGLIASKPSNVTGFWEAERVLDINNVLLKQFGLLWRDDLPLPADWTRHPGAEEARRDIAAYLREEFTADSLFAIKDPRLCRLLPLWLGELEAFGAEPDCLICFRHPVEVAASLQRRDGLPHGPSLYLWMRSYLEAERDTRGRRRMIVSYDALLEDWQAVAGRIANQIGLEWPVSPAVAAEEVGQFLSPEHRHHNESEFDTIPDEGLREAVRAMYHRLEAMAEDEAAGWEGADEAALALLEARERRHGPVIRLERAAYFEERDDKRRLKHYSQRLEEKLRDAKRRQAKLKRRWKLIVAAAVPIAALIGWALGRLI